MGNRGTDCKNVVFILVDDLGWMDVALNGSTYYETPNVQRLAREGMTFTSAYAHPLCSPTRSAILSGQYPHRTGINKPAGHLPDNTNNFVFENENGPKWQRVITKNTRNALPTDLYTIGQAFRDQGYKTGFLGKHHLGVGPEHQMGNRGFEVDLGMPVPGPGSYYDPYFPRHPGNVFDNGPLFKEGENITDRLAREADKFITENKEVPFLLEFWDFSVHAPFQGKKEYIDYFQKTDVPDSPQNGNFHMAAMLKTMDDAVGKILDSLERNGIADRTMVVFIGDNGGNMYNAIDGHFPTNNYPLRQGKGTIYEGGIRVPCVIKLPGVTEPGSECTENIHVVDFYPTLLEVAGIDVPAESFVENGQVLDGMSIVPLLSGVKNALDRPGIFTNFIANVPAPGNTSSAAINSGHWKLILNYELMGGLKEKYELYDLKANISETLNLASQFPDKVAELEALILQHQERIPQAKPKWNPAYDEAAVVPVAHRRWHQWVNEFTLKTENDPIIGEWPKVVRSDDTTAFYEKIKQALILKAGQSEMLANGYDERMEDGQAPIRHDGQGYVPLPSIAEKFGTTVECYDGGIIAIAERPLLLNGAELRRAERLLDSFALARVAYWKANVTITMVQQAEQEDEWENLKRP